MPQTTQQLPSEMTPDIEMVEEIKVTPRSSTSKMQTMQNTKKTGVDVVENAKPGTSRPKSCMKNRTLTFHINYLDNVYKINLSELSTLSKCRQYLDERRFSRDKTSQIIKPLFFFQEILSNLYGVKRL